MSYLQGGAAMRHLSPGWSLVLLVFAASIAPAQEGAPTGAPLAEELRRSGPPVQRPADDPGPPPAAEVFYVPGEYYPDGDTVAWRKGFWAKVQPGWTWVPAQWVRHAEGWSFDEGRWVRSRGARAESSEPVRAGDAAVGPVGPGNVPVYLGGGYPYLGYPGFAVYAPPSVTYTGIGFGGFGPVIPYYNAGFALAYPYGMGWGFGPWGWWGGW
jgi:hypothetical protein